MAIDKHNSLQFLMFGQRSYFDEFGDVDGVYVDRVPFELRIRLLRWTWPTRSRDKYFFQHEGRDVITREGWEAFVRWVGDAMDRQLGAEDNDPQEAEAVKQKSALHYADQMNDLLDVTPVSRQATADEVQQWIDWWGGSYEAAQNLTADEIVALKTSRKWPPVTARMISEMPPPVAQRQAPTDSAVLHAVYTLADYPVLASIAAKRTQARKLDGRACLHLYKSALGDIDWMTITPQEKEFMRQLGIFSICPSCGAQALERDTRDHTMVRADGRGTTVPDLTGDYCKACGEVILDAAEGQRIADTYRQRGG